MNVQVMPTDVGQQLPFYFPFQPSYWGCCSTIASSSSKTLDDNPEAQPLTPLRAGTIPAVSIQHLCKDFHTSSGGTKHAVDDLSLELHEGDITALLGTMIARTVEVCVLVYVSWSLSCTSMAFRAFKELYTSESHQHGGRHRAWFQ